MISSTTTFTFALLTSSCLLAQGPSVTYAAPSPGSLVAVAEGLNAAAAVPVGPLGANNTIQANQLAPLTSSGCGLTFGSTAGSNYRSDAFVGMQAFVTSITGNGEAHFDAEVVGSMSHPTPIQVWITVTLQQHITAGQAVPDFGFDLGNDGSEELSPASAAVLEGWLQLGPNPVEFRTRFQGSTIGDGDVAVGFAIEVRPYQMTIDPLLPGCSDAAFWVQQRFDDAFDFGVVGTPGDLYLTVFGLGSQPIHLGNRPQGLAGNLLPCLLMPSPDAYVLTTSTAVALPATAQQLTIPYAVRPFVLYTQAVRPDALGIATTDAYRVGAY